MSLIDPLDMKEPRISPLTADELGPGGLALATKLRTVFGLSPATELPESIATMLRHPAMYDAQVEYVRKRALASVLAPRDLEIVILRTSWLCRSAYVWGEHVGFGKKAGLTAEEIERLTEGSAAPGWSERDGALNTMIEELHETSFVSDKTWAVIADHFSEQQIIEILTMIGFYHEVAFLYNAMQVRLIPGSRGLSTR
jgi:alkylhydroperoxidase family enzyme